MRERFVLAEESDMLRNVSEAHTPSEAAILWFLRAFQLENKRGATKEEVILYAKISTRTFARAWPSLEKRGLVKQELSITAEGIKHLKTA